MEFLGWKSIKIESGKYQCGDNDNSDSEISLEKIISNVLSSLAKNKKIRFKGPVRYTSNGKVHVEKIYWEDTSINQTVQLPFDTNGNCILKAAINTKKRFDPTKDGRHFAPLRGIKRSGFTGERYIDTCLGSFE